MLIAVLACQACRWSAYPIPPYPKETGTADNVPPVDIATLLTNNTGPIVGGLIGSTSTILAVLITRGTMRSSSRKQRTDDYRREVRSAASTIVGAAGTFIDAAKAFSGSIFWTKEAVRSTPGHNERYLACQKAKAGLDEKLAGFELLIDIDALSTAAFMVHFNSTMADFATFNVSFSSQWPEYTEAQLEDELKQIRKYTEDLEKKGLPKFLECVKKYVPPTIVEENRRRKRLLRPFAASWRWLIKQHRKNLLPSPPKQEPSPEASTLPARDGVAPVTVDHVAT
jgi:hypothetical protein